MKPDIISLNYFLTIQPVGSVNPKLCRDTQFLKFLNAMLTLCTTVMHQLLIDLEFSILIKL